MRKAFSLVELSIVLVILGLLVGGILAGQSLIRAAELRSVSADLSKHRTAFFAFRDKYMGLPGDLRNATSFWGDQATGTGACADADIPNGTPGTCNGDGDGKILHGSSSENVRTWQHLSMAGLIEGSYQGYGSNTSVGLTVPASRITPAGFAIGWYTVNGNAAAGDTSQPNRFLFGTAGGGTTAASAITPEETWNIDTKIDDGIPTSGRMYARTGSTSGPPPIMPSGTCVTGSAYTLDNPGIACAFTYVAD